MGGRLYPCTPNRLIYIARGMAPPKRFVRAVRPRLALSANDDRAAVARAAMVVGLTFVGLMHFGANMG